jgi:MFS transporter, DHA3 family, macrolide efflux protein
MNTSQQPNLQASGETDASVLTGSIFQNRYVQAILVSNLLLQLGIWVRNFAILLYVTDITNNDRIYVSLISVAEFAPIFIFSFIGGTFADRWRPKRTMVWCDILSAVSVFVVLLALIYGSWQAILFATLVSSILSQFSMPSAMKLLKRHLPEEQSQSVMAMFQTLMATFLVIGPIVGTFVYQNYGIYVSIGIMGAMFLLSALVLSFLPKDKAEEASGVKDFNREFKEGFRYVFDRKIMRILGGNFALAGLAVGIIQPLMIFITIDNLGMDKSFLQWLLMANGAAMLVGGGLVFTISKKISAPKLIVLGLLVNALSTIGIGWSTNIPLTFMFYVLDGLFFSCIHIGISTMILLNTEEAFIGRVNGVLNPMFMGMMLVGISVAGVMADVFSLFTAYLVSGLLFLVSTLLLVPLFKTGSGIQEQQPSESPPVSVP